MFHDIHKLSPDYVKKHGFPKPSIFEMNAVIIIMALFGLFILGFGILTILKQGQ
jgi:hypothetical protein